MVSPRLSNGHRCRYFIDEVGRAELNGVIGRKKEMFSLEIPAGESTPIHSHQEATMGVRPEYFMAAQHGSPYYGRPRRVDELIGPGESLQGEELPAGWLRQTWGVWEGWTPRDWTPRLQGWKIHVSASLGCARETLARTTRVCAARGVAFKFLPVEGMLADSNGKQNDRGASGKFITIYPDDDAQLGELLDELDETLTGQEGPYILSDLRFRDAPVYVRYGAIMALNFPDPTDRPVAAIVTGDALTLTEDHRQPRFSLPDGVQLPACLEESYARSRQSSPSRLREFKAISALHFSNAGGVYKATLPDGARHVLREARPHTGLDGRGRDAIARQRDEEITLTELADVPGVQRLLGSFSAWEHRYLELEYVDGRTLTAWMVQNSACDVRDGGEKKRAYVQRAHHVVRQLIDTVQRIHERGWCIGDLHPGNIMVTESDEVVILDFEDATRRGEDRAVGFRVFEFCAPEEFSAEQADWYAVSRSIMLLYFADWELEVIAPAFWDRARSRLASEFGAESAAQLDEVMALFPATERHLLSPREPVGLWDERPHPDAAIVALDEGITWSRQFSPRNSYPGDCSQPGDVSETWGYGRAGVAWARARIGRPVPDDDIAALERAAEGVLRRPALGEVGRPEQAVAAARTALAGAEARRRLDLQAGLTGVLLAGFELAGATRDDDLLERCRTSYERLHRAVAAGGSSLAALTHRRGLHFGLSGLALVDLSAHRATGEAPLLDRAIDRITDEVAACFVTADGDMMVRDVDNNRALPYLEWGSAGVWVVVMIAERLAKQQLLTDEQRAAFARACSSDFYVYPSLLHGRAGTLAALAADGTDHAEIQRQQDFVLDTLLHREGMAFTAGDGFLRLSSDLATGAAGVALGLHSVRRGRPFDWLPLAKGTADALAGLPTPQPVPGFVPASLAGAMVGHG